MNGYIHACHSEINLSPLPYQWMINVILFPQLAFLLPLSNVSAALHVVGGVKMEQREVDTKGRSSG